jgi:hypothetical protein
MFFTLEELDRTLVRLIQLELINIGVAVDPLGKTVDAYVAAKAALLSSLGPNGRIVEVYGVASSEKRDEKTSCKIIIDRRSIPLGDIGGFGVKYFDKTGDGAGATFTKRQYPASTRDINYEIRLISDRTDYERIMQNVLSNVFGEFGYVNSVRSDTGALTDKVFYIEKGTGVNMSESNMIEWMIPYTIKDIFITSESVDGQATGGKLVRADIPTMKKVTIEKMNSDSIDIE